MRKAAEEVEREKSEAVSFLSLCKWKAPLPFSTEGFFASEAVGPIQSQRGEWGAEGCTDWIGEGSHRPFFTNEAAHSVLTVACLLKLKSKWGGRCHHVFMHPLFREMRRDHFYSAFWHMHTWRLALRRAQPILFSGEVMRFDAIIPKDEWAQAATLSLWVCVCFCVCVPVKVGSIVSALSWRFFSLLTCCWDFEATEPVDCIRKTELLPFLLLLHTLDWTFNDFFITWITLRCLMWDCQINLNQLWRTKHTSDGHHHSLAKVMRHKLR